MAGFRDSAVMNAARVVAARAAAVRIQHFIRNQPTLEERLDFIGFAGLGGSFVGHGDTSIRILQARGEILTLCALLADEPPRRVLEIGTAGGGTIFMFSGVAAADAVLVTVDLPPPAGYRAHRESLLRAFALPGQTIHPVRADSHDDATPARVSALLGGPVDFLFIDGDHAPESVRRDWELYGPLLRPGGIVAFHDIVPGEHVGGVPEFWAELKANGNAETSELIERPDQRNFGIGLLRVPADGL